MYRALFPDTGKIIGPTLWLIQLLDFFLEFWKEMVFFRNHVKQLGVILGNLSGK